MYTPPKFHSGLDIGEALELADVGGGVSGLPAIDASLATGLVAVAASQAEAEAGTEVALRSYSPLRVGQAIAALAAGGHNKDFVTVGSGTEDYANIAAAIAAGEYNIRLTSSITETTSVIPNASINVWFDGPEIGLTFSVNQQWTSGGYTQNFNVYLNGGYINRSQSSGGAEYLFDFTGTTTAKVNFYGGGLLQDNGSTLAGSALCNPVVHTKMFGHYKLTCSNLDDAKIECTSSFYADSLNFVGGGPACESVLKLSGACFGKIGLLEFSGTYSTNSADRALIASMTNGETFKIGVLESSTASNIGYKVGCEIGSYLSTNRIELTSASRILSGVGAPSSYEAFPSPLGAMVFKGVVNAGFSIEPGRIEYKTISTTDATQTELTIVGTNRFTLASDQTALVNIRVLAQRDNQDWASFLWLNCVIANDGGVYAITNGTASTTPDQSKGTGSTLTLALDASSGLRIRGTAQAAQNWDWKTIIDIISVAN
jgi:hypothetical protein